MTDHKVFNDLANIALATFKDKPTSLTEGQQEASVLLWTSADGHSKLGVWECQPGRFTADRSTTTVFIFSLPKIIVESRKPKTITNDSYESHYFIFLRFQIGI